MKRYGNLYEKIYDLENLKRAHKEARKDKAYYEAVKKTDDDLDNRLLYIQDLLKNEKYKVNTYKTSVIQDRNKRRILYKLPYYPDRIIQWAILLQIDFIFAETMTDFSCASLPRRGIHYATKKLDHYMINNPEDTKYCLKLDIKKFYPSIDRNILKQLLRKKIKDKKLLKLLDQIIESMANADISHLNISKDEYELYTQPGKGIPVGSYLSQYLANFYLTYFDHWLKEELGCKYVIRYMDDLVILSGNKEILHYYLKEIKKYLYDKLLLNIKSNYQIFSVQDRGIDFVGYRHFHGYKLMRKSTLKRCKQSMIKLQEYAESGEICNKNLWCSYISYMGWLSWCNSYKFFMKYCINSLSYINQYYRKFIKGNSKKKRRKQIVINKSLFMKNYNHHVGKYKLYNSHKIIHNLKGV